MTSGARSSINGNNFAEKSNKGDEEEEELASLRDRFIVVLGTDFQNLMSKLLPNWGLSPKPRSTYILATSKN